MKKGYLALLILLILLIITNPTNIKRHEEKYLQKHFIEENITDFKLRQFLRESVDGMFSVDNYILFSVGVKTEPTDSYSVTIGIFGIIFLI